MLLSGNTSCAWHCIHYTNGQHFFFKHSYIASNIQSEKEPIVFVGPLCTHINIKNFLLNVVGMSYEGHLNFLSVPFHHQSHITFSSTSSCPPFPCLPLPRFYGSVQLQHVLLFREMFSHHTASVQCPAGKQ